MQQANQQPRALERAEDVIERLVLQMTEMQRLMQAQRGESGPSRSLAPLLRLASSALEEFINECTVNSGQGEPIMQELSSSNCGQGGQPSLMADYGLGRLEDAAEGLTSEADISNAFHAVRIGEAPLKQQCSCDWAMSRIQQDITIIKEAVTSANVCEMPASIYTMVHAIGSNQERAQEAFAKHEESLIRIHEETLKRIEGCTKQAVEGKKDVKSGLDRLCRRSEEMDKSLCRALNHKFTLPNASSVPLLAVYSGVGRP